MQNLRDLAAYFDSRRLFEGRGEYSTSSQLRTLTEALNVGSQVRVSGSPLSELFFLISDLLSIAGLSTGIGKEQKVFPGLSFRDHLYDDSEEAIWDPEDYATDERFPLFDPLTGLNYAYSADPLGNPLQEEVEFESSTLFTPKDAQKLQSVLGEIEQFLTFLANGRIDWTFVRSILRKTPTISSRQNSHSKANHEYYTRNRKRKRGNKTKTK